MEVGEDGWGVGGLGLVCVFFLRKEILALDMQEKKWLKMRIKKKKSCQKKKN